MTEDEGAAIQLSLDASWGTPPDDVGAETAARYRFQAEVIAKDAIVCLASGTGAVVCEWQEDAIVLWGADDVELVSVKHREVSQGAWSRGQLIEEGGLRHLFERWTSTGRRARCRLATNGGLRPEARRLRDACAGDDDDARRQLASDISTRMRATADEVLPFLRILRIEDGLPARGHIGAVNVGQVMRPALRRMGITSVSPDAAYAAIVQVVEVASRDRPETSDTLEVVMDPTRLDALALSRRRLAGRTLRPDRLRQAVASARGSDRVRLVLENGPTATALDQKLLAGGLGPTSRQAAKALRASWSLFEKEMMDPLGGVGDIDEFAVRLVTSVSSAETEAMSTPDVDGTWGRQMQQLIRARISGGEMIVPTSVPSDNALIEGFIYELTDRCLIWWSEHFDLAVAS